MKNPVDFRKILGCIILSLLWLCCFLFIKPTLVVDWVGDGSVTTNFLMLVSLIGLLIIILYHIFYRSNPVTTRLSLTVFLTMTWLALIFFYPFNVTDPTTGESGAIGAGGAIGFFTLLGGLAICVLWVHFFADEAVVTA